MKNQAKFIALRFMNNGENSFEMVFMQGCCEVFHTLASTTSPDVARRRSTNSFWLPCQKNTVVFIEEKFGCMETYGQWLCILAC